EYPERGQVRLQIHVRFLDADEAVDRRAVKHDLAIECRFELSVGNLDVLDRSQNVGELQAHELHTLAFDALEYLRFRNPGVAALGSRVRLCHAEDFMSGGKRN